MPPPRRKRVSKAVQRRRQKPKVFVVHGHNVAIRESVARVLERLGCEALILHELPNQGKTIFQKFSTYAAVEFAVILLTADDRGGEVSKPCRKQKKRARQNVILELGFFLGALGPERVCALYDDGVELPSDYSGVVYISLDPNEKWKALLARELHSAGLRIDTASLTKI